MRRRWIRGKALETLMALRGIQPGDEVLLKFDWKGRGLSERDRGILVYEEHAVPFVIEESFCDSLVGCEGHYLRKPTADARDPKGGWGCLISEIVAWRPGRKA